MISSRRCRPERSHLHPSPQSGCSRRRAGGLLLRPGQRGAMAALPYHLHAPDLPPSRLGAVRRRQPEVRRGRGPGGRNPAESHCPWCRTTISRLLPAACVRGTTSQRRSSSPSGTSPGPMPRSSESALGSEEMLDGLLGKLPSSAFHTQLHCNNFIGYRRPLAGGPDRPRASDECRRRHGMTLVRPYPITIAMAPCAAGRHGVGRLIDATPCLRRVQFASDVAARRGRGTIRFHQGNSTIAFRAVEIPAGEAYPEWIGRFVLLADRRARRRSTISRLPGESRRKRSRSRPKSTPGSARGTTGPLSSWSSTTNPNRFMSCSQGGGCLHRQQPA